MSCLRTVFLTCWQSRHVYIGKYSEKLLIVIADVVSKKLSFILQNWLSIDVPQLHGNFVRKGKLWAHVFMTLIFKESVNNLLFSYNSEPMWHFNGLLYCVKGFIWYQIHVGWCKAQPSKLLLQTIFTGLINLLN